jgi:Transcriptional regulator containing an amidase domain and an AraC-type DNA-binding HTH domain
MNCDQISFYKTERNEVEIIYCKDSKINYSEHNHISIYTIGIILEGEIELSTKYKKSHLTAGDFFVIYPYDVHSISPVKDGYSMFSVCLKIDFINTYDKAQMSRLLSDLTEPFVQKGLLQQGHIQSIATAIDMIYEQLISDERINHAYNEVKMLLEMEPESDTGLVEMADSVFVSKYHFIREFKKYIGMTPHKFKIQIRIRKAQYMLREGRDLTEIALTTGFYDQSHFIRWFKQIVGMSPSDYKEACKKL